MNHARAASILQGPFIIIIILDGTTSLDSRKQETLLVSQTLFHAA